MSRAKSVCRFGKNNKCTYVYNHALLFTVSDSIVCLFRKSSLDTFHVANYSGSGTARIHGPIPTPALYCSDCVRLLGTQVPRPGVRVRVNMSCHCSHCTITIVYYIHIFYISYHLFALANHCDFSTLMSAFVILRVKFFAHRPLSFRVQVPVYVSQITTLL